MIEVTMNKGPPLLELRVDDSVGEALATDTDPFQYTVTLQLVQHQFGVDEACIHMTNNVRHFYNVTLQRTYHTWCWVGGEGWGRGHITPHRPGTAYHGLRPFENCAVHRTRRTGSVWTVLLHNTTQVRKKTPTIGFIHFQSTLPSTFPPPPPPQKPKQKTNQPHNKQVETPSQYCSVQNALHREVMHGIVVLHNATPERQRDKQSDTLSIT